MERLVINLLDLSTLEMPVGFVMNPIDLTSQLISLADEYLIHAEACNLTIGISFP